MLSLLMFEAEWHSVSVSELELDHIFTLCRHMAATVERLQPADFGPLCARS